MRTQVTTGKRGIRPIGESPGSVRRRTPIMTMLHGRVDPDVARRLRDSRA
jgi:hypothetical protein